MSRFVVFNRGVRLTNGEVPAYNIAGVPWSKLECPTEGSGHGNLRNGHAGATTSAAGIWVEGRLCARSRHLFVVRCAARLLP